MQAARHGLLQRSDMHVEKGWSMTVHKFRVGQVVDFIPSRPGVPASVRDYKILRLLPADGQMPMYRIKTIAEPYERVAKENELARRSTGSDSHE